MSYYMKDMVQIYLNSSHNFTKAMFSKQICRPKIHDLAVFVWKVSDLQSFDAFKANFWVPTLVKGNKCIPKNFWM